MEIEKGVVIDQSKDRILVESAATAGCLSCGARDTCMTGKEQMKRRLWIENTLGAGIGNTVSFSIEEKTVLFSSLLLYLFPVVLLISGILIGTQKSVYFSMSEDLAGALGGIVGLILAMIIVKIVSSILSKKKSFVPLLIEIIKDDPVKECE